MAKVNDEISIEERDEAILHMFNAGKNVEFISDKLGVPVGIVVDMQKQWMKGELSMPVQADISKEERNELIVSYRNEGMKLKSIAEKLNIPYHIVNNIVQKSKKKVVKKPLKTPKVKSIKPLREKDIDIKPVVVEKVPKQAIVKPVEEEMVNTSQTGDNGFKTQILDLNKQLDRFRENEKNMQLKLIDQKQSYEKVIKHFEESLAAERDEKEKAYADYLAEVENNKRFRKQVEDLLMVDGLNVGLMQQNLMFRERFGMLQEGERL
ncbi:hypothetical protein MKY29_12140 [Psychrobacillus sp. FSL K6-2365]|uniref:hypothetical protein n=1 Tax=Psychrobacillus sp. FSL K6-2365 TaxID=2921546 RepID=UPI0030FC62DE